MTNKIKVDIITGGHSSGRGIGVYAQSLISAFKKSKDIIITDHDPDIIHYPYFDLFYHTLPLKKEKPTIITIHDLTPLVMSDRYPKGIKGSFNLLRQWYSLRSVSAIITDSESSKRDIESYLRISPDKIFVTPLAVEDTYKSKPSAAKIAEVKKKYNLPDKFVFNISSGPNPNKNIPSLAEVTDRLGIPLVIVGRGMVQEVVKPVHPELIDLVRLQVYNHLLILGSVPSDEVNAIFHLATLYVQPSYVEGFGIPILEAMTAGCLISCSNTSSLPEVYYDGAITFNPKKLKSIENAIQKALKLTPKKKAEHIKLGQTRAKDFTWNKTASLTAEVYKKVIS